MKRSGVKRGGSEVEHTRGRPTVWHCQLALGRVLMHDKAKDGSSGHAHEVK